MRWDGIFAGQVAIVTAAATGIGEATARQLASGGAQVALVDIDEGGVKRVAGELAKQGAVALPLRVDVTQSTEVNAMVDRVVAEFGGLDILVNAVGGWTIQKTVQTTTEEEWNRGLALNVTSTFLCSKAAIPHLIARGGGRIVNVSSEAARAQVHYTTPFYTAAKAGMLALTRQLAKELGPHQITVNAVAPGPVYSLRTRAAWPPDLVQQMIAASPLGRIAEPVDIADVIVFLASDGARNMTGATVDVNGGHLLI